MVVIRRVAGATAVAALICLAAFAQNFKSKSQLPPQRREIAKDHALDSCSDMDGDATRAKNKLQNEAKNNFYITGDPVTVNYNTFIRLMRKAEDERIPYGSDGSVPADRSVVKGSLSDCGVTLGEGTLVRFVAQPIEARRSNVQNGESVNCGESGNEDNDIHVNVGQQSTDEGCLSVTAEISPHFRPESWDSIDGADFGNRPLRLTGPLFFDASQTPFKPGEQINRSAHRSGKSIPFTGLTSASSVRCRGVAQSDESACGIPRSWPNPSEKGRESYGEYKGGSCRGNGARPV
jgi:hypothetical protein